MSPLSKMEVRIVLVDYPLTRMNPMQPEELEEFLDRKILRVISREGGKNVQIATIKFKVGNSDGLNERETEREHQGFSTNELTDSKTGSNPPQSKMEWVIPRDILQTDTQSDKRIQRPTKVPNVQDQWENVIKILGRQGKSYRVEMKDGTERIVKPEMVPPVLKTEYNQQTASRTRPILSRRAKQMMRN